MITAQEAKQLYEQSASLAQEFLDKKVEPQIRAAAEEGKRNVTIHMGAAETWQMVGPNKLKDNVLRELERLGYTVEFRFYGESYVPRGLADDLGGGPEHRNYGYIISW